MSVANAFAVHAEVFGAHLVGMPTAALSAGNGGTMFLGDDLIPYLVLALGAALFVGNVAAMVRPRRADEGGQTVRAPARRAVPLALVGFVAALWALATLLAG
ncbi:hypothetical protein [Candidatus Poriferisodalis sp.]|uniref:hypothetical protein n=1 Tax=Candidatus Poriferisodalis sp. TaxID=3101277 RepID=UPI003B52F786